MQLAGEDRKNENGKPIPRADNTVRLELALLGHLFTIAIKEWGIGLVVNPVMSIRRPAPGPGRNRRLTEDEEKRLLAAVGYITMNEHGQQVDDLPYGEYLCIPSPAGAAD